jgi:UDP-N-acetylbacillosamine N-acetyltransferase
MKKIAIYGASGHGKVVADVAMACGYEIAFFVDDDASKLEFYGHKVYRFGAVQNMVNISFALGLGSNHARAEKFFMLKKFGFGVTLLVHPTAIISPTASLQEGAVVMPSVVINANANIEQGVILNSSCVIEHDCIIREFAHISPLVGLAGGVNVGKLAHVGIGAKVIQGIKIGADSIVGAGAIVVGDIGEKVLAVGVPAKEIKRL